MTQVIACALQLGGMPVPKGGGVELVEGLATIVRDAGGELRTESDVERIVVSGGSRDRACASRAARRCPPSRPCSPASRRRSSTGGCSARRRAAARAATPPRRFRYGRGEMQIHLAMNELPRWRGDERLARTPILHLTPGLDGVSRAVNEADRGLLPAEATIVLRPAAGGRPVARAGRLVDALGPAPGAAAATQGRRRGGELDTVAGLDGGAAGGVRRPDRRRGSAATSRISRRATIGRVVMSPADIEARTRTGSAATSTRGSCALDQNLLFRPTPASPGHGTPVDGLWHIGASTHPGPGLGAGSGYLARSTCTQPPLRRRLLAQLPGVP